ncbi:hypothetical protein ACQKKX_17985 [Neorhizobium sp. NPDC001467]|uniref:hypothetical protein n=1 Tax=Neorhizobium sp. NPDC001467 TaxID=3390595 RepID=UPI003CFF68E0
MTTTVSIILLVSINIGLLWLMMAAPLGQRTITLRRSFAHDPRRLWQAMRPQGNLTDWSPDVTAVRHGPALGLTDGQVELSMRYPDRRGQPVRRLCDLTESIAEDGVVSTSCRIIADSTLANSFWSRFHEERRIEPAPGGATLTLNISDHYRGLAFYLFRFFAMRREMTALETWLDTGRRQEGSLFTHPLTQIALAALSTLMLWPFFGLNGNGLAISILLTLVIILHELGHIAAYRAFGHQRVMLIFVPMLGGIAIGGRPYRSRFEIATCAMMGAGLSAFLVPVLVLVHASSGLEARILPVALHLPSAVLLLILGGFNLLNLLPMSRFDGGQVIRQVFPGRLQVLASLGLTLIVLMVGYEIGIPAAALVAGLAVVTLISLIGFRTNILRDELDPMSAPERLMAGFGLYAAVTIHSYAVITACKILFQE